MKRKAREIYVRNFYGRYPDLIKKYQSNLLDMLFSFVLYFLWVLSLENNFCSALKFCVFSGVMLSIRPSFYLKGIPGSIQVELK